MGEVVNMLGSVGVRGVVVALLGLGACAPYDELWLQIDRDPPVDWGAVSGRRIVGTVGTAMVVYANALDSDGNSFGNPSIGIRSPDEHVMLVEPTTQAHRFLLVALNVGETCLDVYVDDRKRDCIPTRVVEESAESDGDE